MSLYVRRLFDGSEQSLYYLEKSHPNEIVMIEGKNYSSSLIVFSCQASPPFRILRFHTSTDSIRVRNECDRTNYQQDTIRLTYSNGLLYYPNQNRSVSLSCYRNDSRIKIINDVRMDNNVEQFNNVLTKGKQYACFVKTYLTMYRSIYSKVFLFELPNDQHVHPASKFFVTKIISETREIRLKIEILPNIQSSNISYFGVLSEDQNYLSTVLLMCDGCSRHDLNFTRKYSINATNSLTYFDPNTLYEDSVHFNDLKPNSLYEIKWWGFVNDNPPVIIRTDIVWTIGQTNVTLNLRRTGLKWICLESNDKHGQYRISIASLNTTWNYTFIFRETDVINITNLSPNKMYVIQWEIRNGARWIALKNNKIFVKTQSTRPNPPIPHSRFAINATSIKLSWKAPPNEDSQKLNYRIECVGDSIIKIFTRGNSTILTLHPDTKYFCFIYAINEQGESYPSQAIPIQSPSTEDKIIENLTLEAIGSNKITVSWQAPNNKSSIIYIILLSSIESNGKVCKDAFNVILPESLKSRYISQNSYRVPKQHACANKTLPSSQSVNASIIDEKVYFLLDKLDTFNVKYSINVIPYIPFQRQTQGEMAELTTNLLPRWKYDIIRDHDMIFVNVKWNSTIFPLKLTLLHNGKKDGHYLVKKNQNISFQHLTPFTSYELKSCLYNSLTSGCLPIMMDKTIIQTLKDSPSPALNFTYTILNQTMVQFTWEPPKYPNGEMVTYEVDCEVPESIKWTTNSTSLQIPINPNLFYECYLRADNEEYHGHDTSAELSFGNLTSFCQDVGLFDFDFEKQHLIWQRSTANCKRSQQFFVFITIDGKADHMCEYGWVVSKFEFYRHYEMTDYSEGTGGRPSISFRSKPSDVLGDFSYCLQVIRYLQLQENSTDEVIHLTFFEELISSKYLNYQVHVIARADSDTTSRMFTINLTKLNLNNGKSSSSVAIVLSSLFVFIAFVAILAFIVKKNYQKIHSFTNSRYIQRTILNEDEENIVNDVNNDM